MHLKFWKILLGFGFYGLMIVCLQAQRVYWKNPTDALAKDQTSSLELVFEDCQPDGEPQLPNIDGLAFGAPSANSEYSMENFKISQRAVFSYPVQPSRQGTVIIPAFTVETSEGPLIVPALTLQVGNATLSQGQTFLNDVVLSQIRPAKKSVWQGEIFNLDYILLVSPRYHAELAGVLQWSPDGLALEDWSSPTQVQAQMNGENRQGVQYLTRACALKNGLLNFSPAQQKLNIQTGTERFGFFSRPKLQQYTIESEPLSLEIKPLPNPPQDFFNAVGKFKLISRIVPRTVTVGEPVTWTLELSGTGNWPAGLNLPQREVAQNFRVIEPKTKLVKPEGKPFEGTLTEDVILIPTQPGQYTLGPLTYSYFDPDSGNYVTLSMEPETIEVKPSTNPLAASPTLPPTAGDTPYSKPSEDLSLLPHEPIEKNTKGLTPKNSNFFYIAASPFFAFLALWIFLAFRRSKLTDPLAPQKQAKTKILSLIQQLQSNPADDLCPFLIDWQHLVIQFLKIQTVTPSAQEIQEKANLISHSSTEQRWYELWQEAEQVLFSSHKQLPPNWLENARQAVLSTPLARQSIWTVFLPRNLFPIYICLALWSLQPHSFAQNVFPELASYQSGDFKAAEATLLIKTRQRPFDWAARNNLALTLAQQKRWAEATAHWAAGRLLNPRNEDIRWNYALGIKHTNFSDSHLLALTQKSLFLLASPAEWQWFFFIAFCVLVLSLCLIFLQRYQIFWGSKMRLLSYCLFCISSILALSSWLNWQRYHALANPKAGLIWQTAQLRSIPTDSDTQASHEIAPGTVAIINKTFLSWLKVTLPNQETGWIRKDTFIYFYQSS